MMEKLLTGLFDYQKFDAVPALQDVIDDVMSRYSRGTAMSDDMLGMVAAAGTGMIPPKDEDQL